MADNFLEKHYQEYQARKASMGGAAKTTKKKPVTPKLKKNVLIADGCTPIGKAVVQAFCNEDCKVAFCGADKEIGLTLAKETGAAFFHTEEQIDSLLNTMDSLHNRWGHLDILVLNSARTAPDAQNGKVVEAFNEIVTQDLRQYLMATERWMQQHNEPQNGGSYGRLLLVCPPTAIGKSSISLCNQMTINGIHSITQSLSQDKTDTGLTVNTITPQWEEVYSTSGNPDGVAHLCVFLAQQQNSGIYGENLKVQAL